MTATTRRSADPMDGSVGREAVMLSALDLARRIEAGELTPAAVIDRCAAAIAAREDEIGAFATLDVPGTRRAAEANADSLAGLPLRGLPVGIKDIFDTVDFPTEYGSTVYRGYRPPWDSSAVAMVRRAGGLILGKTVTTEFAHQRPGKTRNPHNPAHTPGGSSSGSAAAVAAGMLPIALGTQTAGSVIRPAAFCGVAGFKPSFRLIPTVGVKCFSWTLDTVGVFAAGVADAAFAAAAITGRDLRVDGAAHAAPRIALLRSSISSEASADMQAALDTAARAAAAGGAHVSGMTLPSIVEDAWEVQPLVQDYEAWRSLAFEHDHHVETLGPKLRELLDRGAEITAEAYDAARRTTKQARRALADIFTDVDAILAPSAPGAAPHSLDSTGSPIFNRLWTLMGTPAVSVPGLADPTGLPLGVQIVGRFGRDRATLEAAAFVEAAIARRR
jgi:Asp-tRNA(Asn)/Glu-tRNA(Gln) amidotransferase A subunit family amidase